MLFCNVLPDGTPDKRTVHRALPVAQEGLWKYGMNVWMSADNLQEFAQVGTCVKASGKPTGGSGLLQQAEEATTRYLDEQRAHLTEGYWMDEPVGYTLTEVRNEGVVGNSELGYERSEGDGGYGSAEVVQDEEAGDDDGSTSERGSSDSEQTASSWTEDESVIDVARTRKRKLDKGDDDCPRL